MRNSFDNSFLTGCPAIDAQHQRLFEVLDDFIESGKKGADIPALQRYLNFLSDYALKHFFEEETLLKKNGFSGFDQHRSRHEKFVVQWKEMVREFIMSGLRGDTAEKIEKHISGWLKSHIKGEDMIWARELKVKAPHLFQAKMNFGDLHDVNDVNISKEDDSKNKSAMDVSFLTGISEIDAQHQTLFDGLSDLVSLSEKGVEFEVLLKCLNFISDYAVKHFFDEEQLLKKYGFSDIKSHLQYHVNFSSTVKELMREFIMKGASSEAVSKIQTLVSSWLVSHIKGQDLIWAAELKTKAPHLFA